MLELISPWTFAALAASVVAFYTSARGLQIGPGVEVIALTAVAANLTAIVGGILVFRDSDRERGGGDHRTDDRVRPRHRRRGPDPGSPSGHRYTRQAGRGRPRHDWPRQLRRASEGPARPGGRRP